MVVEINVFNQVFGGVFSQYNKIKELYPVTFFLIKYIFIEYNYKIYNKELIVIIKVFKEQRLELQGFKDVAKVVTDYKSFKYFTITKLLN